MKLIDFIKRKKFAFIISFVVLLILIYYCFDEDLWIIPFAIIGMSVGLGILGLFGLPLYIIKEKYFGKYTVKRIVLIVIYYLVLISIVVL